MNPNTIVTIIVLVISCFNFVHSNIKMGQIPQPSKQSNNGGSSNEMAMQARPIIRIVRMKSISDIDGNYNYMYESENGIRMQEQGFVKQGEKKEDHINVAQGSYSYTSPEGMPITVNYIADENGFQILENEDSDEIAPPMKQRTVATTTTTTTQKPRPSTTENNNQNPSYYINEQALKQGSAQQFYRFFHKQPAQLSMYTSRPEEEPEDVEVTDQYDNY
uniref:CSON013508 protein n=1 Tax=Culicoides sonorensis TaxID=179676 RepID=A0A336LN18_CULSO